MNKPGQRERVPERRIDVPDAHIAVTKSKRRVPPTRMQESQRIVYPTMPATANGTEFPAPPSARMWRIRIWERAKGRAANAPMITAVSKASRRFSRGVTVRRE
jgi:hypothetical protein